MYDLSLAIGTSSKDVFTKVLYLLVYPSKRVFYL